MTNLYFTAQANHYYFYSNMLNHVQLNLLSCKYDIDPRQVLRFNIIGKGFVEHAVFLPPLFRFVVYVFSDVMPSLKLLKKKKKM